ncbi:hypothetical protein K1719_036948 [Acacia pycnantha]|nr:hypothetical protein K1719_036948 [Acacia pycnantha]
MSLAGSFSGAPAWPSTFFTSICSELVHFSDLDLSYPRPFVPPQVPRAPTIGIFGLIFLLFLPSEAEILKVVAIIIIIYEGIMSMLEKSESGIWMVIKDVGKLETTTEQLDATMRSLVHVLEEIESNSEQLLINETDRIEASKSLRSWMKEGQKLVCESSYDMAWWNFVKKWQYQKRMAELDNKLLRIRSLYLQARLAKNIEDRHKMEGTHIGTRRHESYSMHNNNATPISFQV